MRLFLSLMILLLPIWSAAAETIRIPKDHYLGISQPCQSAFLARQSAFNELVKQIARTIGGHYSMNFKSQVRQTGESFYQHASEEIKYTASGFLTGIEGNVVSESYDETDDGIVCQVMAHLSARTLDRMRQLSIGAKVLVSDLGGDVFEFREVNGVDVTLTSAEITITEKNRHARFISYYFMKINSGRILTMALSLPEPVFLKAGKIQQVQLRIPSNQSSLSDKFTGKMKSYSLIFFGTDELGRNISVNYSK